MILMHFLASSQAIKGADTEKLARVRCDKEVVSPPFPDHLHGLSPTHLNWFLQKWGPAAWLF